MFDEKSEISVKMIVETYIILVRKLIINLEEDVNDHSLSMPKLCGQYVF